ncbi:MAG: putative bifunctional diguanylate cyclase/phosphodiesterase [Rubrivivax sp.]
MPRDPELSPADLLSALEAQRDELFEQAPFGSCSIGPDGRLTSINDVALAWLGWNRNEWPSQPVAAGLFTPGSRQRLAAGLSGGTPSGSDELPLDLLLRSGATRPVSAQLSALTHPGLGPMGGHRLLMFDNRVRQHEQVRQRMAAISFDTPCGICLMHADGTMAQANAAFTALTGYPLEALRGQPLQMLDSGRQGPAFYSALWQELRAQGRWQGEVHQRRRDNSCFNGWMNLSSIADDQGRPLHYVARLYDITAYVSAQHEIDRLAFFDPLTQLPNRRLLLERLEQAIGQTHSSGRCAALLFIDIDHFKTINDTRGHAAGDQLLVEVAQRLRQTARTGDTVARLGGDEFVSLLVDLDSHTETAVAQAMKVGRKLLDVLDDCYQLGNYSFSTSASMGVAVMDGSQSVSDVLQQADLAMYDAKRAGRNEVRRFQPAMKLAADEHLAIREELAQALRRGEFELHYQAQCDGQRRAFSAEALLRWNHPTRGLLGPAHFLPSAEQTGLIAPIGRWVLETACRQLGRWAEHAPTRGLCLAVNVSALQFRDVDFMDHLRESLQRGHADPTRLMLELTESTVHSVDDIRAQMLALRPLGVQFALDDVGVGYSSLARLIGLPIDQLKIDRSFVQDMAHGVAAAVVVNTIIGMADSLGMDVMAEGVETPEQLKALQAAGCLHFQGYLFSRPVPLAAFESLVASGANPLVAPLSAAS